MEKTMKKVNVKDMVFTGLCIAMCVVLPIAFHIIPDAGTVFCPMHIPVLFCGLVCGWQYGLLCGVVGPLLSSLFTGMPPAAILPSMMIELAIYGLVASLMMRLVRTKIIYADIYLSLITAMLAGRVVSVLVKYFIFAKGTPVAVLLTAVFVTSLPGIITHLIAIPIIYFALEKAKIIDKKY